MMEFETIRENKSINLLLLGSFLSGLFGSLLGPLITEFSGMTDATERVMGLEVLFGLSDGTGLWKYTRTQKERDINTYN